MLFLQDGGLGNAMLTVRNEQGFTLVELMIAMLILTVAILGIGASAGRLSSAAGEAELKALAVQAVEDRINFVRLDPVYDSLAARYAASESSLLGLPGYTRTTAVTRSQIAQPGGKTLDYTTITVKVDGGGLSTPIVREIVVGAP